MKIVNNSAYQAYNHLVNGYDEKNIARGFDHESNKQFIRGTVSLASVHAPNPFLKGSREAHLYYRICYCYGMWQRAGIDAKVNRRRMLQAAAELAAMNLPNPFGFEIEPVIEPSTDVVSLEALAEAEHEKTIAEDIASETYVPVEEPVHIMGVLPEKEDE